MTEKELLQSYYDEEMDRVFSASGNDTMTFPRKGYESEWHMAKEKAALLEQMIERMEDKQ